MASSFQQWESDPLFSAAEVVQDSADRMDSIFRILLHEQSLVQGDPADQKLLNSVENNRRDLATALGTTKWQLEDFERAVDLSALTDSSGTREDAISRHKQFIRAIREQIIHVERGLEGTSKGIPARNSQWMDLNEKDRDGLALFLTGGNPVDHLSQCNSGSNILRRFLDSSKASEFDEKSDEIVELKTEEIDDSRMNGAMRINHSFDHLKENKLRKVGSGFGPRLGFETSIPINELVGDDEDGSWNLEIPDSNAKSFFSKNKLRGSRYRLDVVGSLSNLWSVYGTKMSRSFTKRTKDGEVRTDSEQKPSSSSYFEIYSSEQVRHTWMGLAFGSSISCGFCSDVFKDRMQSFHRLADYRRGYQRLRYIIQSNQFPVWIAAAILFTLTVLGILILRVT